MFVTIRKRLSEEELNKMTVKLLNKQKRLLEEKRNPTDESMAVCLHGKEKIEDVTPTDFYSPYLSMLKAGYGSLCYQGTWSIYDLELVNYNLAAAPKGGLRIQPVTNNKKKWYDGVIFKRPWLTTQEGQYAGYPFRTFSNGAFVGGYSDQPTLDRKSVV